MQMENSRTKNVISNVKIGMIVQILNRIITFIVRTIFIRILNTEYLGVNGLFTNVLSILSFAELGIGTAIIYNMYKPVAVNDIEKIKSLMQLYKKCYNIIGTIVFFLGLCLIPFMRYIIKDVPNIKENIILIYVLFLLNTSFSYFFTYKKSIISAYQQHRIISKFNSLFHLITAILQIIFLILTKNYIVYLIIQIIMTMIENIYFFMKANKLFPYLKDEKIVPLNIEEKNEIFHGVKSLVIYKFGEKILSSTDNIIISSIINVSTVGICSNYTLIIESVRSLLNNSFNGITASIGNLNAVESNEKKERILYEYMFVCFWIYSFCAVAFIVLLNPFISVWLGTKYTLSYIVPLSLALSFWVVGIRTPVYTYRVTMGLFSKSKFIPFLASVINIILSVVLGKSIGVAGVFFATSISQIFSYFWADPYIIYKYELKNSQKKYWLKIIKYSIIFTVSVIVTFCFISLINIDSKIISLFLKASIVAVIPNLIYYVLLHKSDEYKSIRYKIFKK